MQTLAVTLTTSAQVLQGALGAISYVRGLRVLRIEDLHCRLETEAVMDLGALAQVCRPPHNMCRLHAAPALALISVARHDD